MLETLLALSAIMALLLLALATSIAAAIYRQLLALGDILEKTHRP